MDEKTTRTIMFHCSNFAISFELEDSRTCYDEIGHVSLSWNILDVEFESVYTHRELMFFRGKTPKARIDKAYRRAYKELNSWIDISANDIKRLVKFFDIK